MLLRVYRGIILPNYMGILINHYKDPYSPSSIMESKRVFFVAHMKRTHLSIHGAFKTSEKGSFRRLISELRTCKLYGYGKSHEIPWVTSFFLYIMHDRCMICLKKLFPFEEILILAVSKMFFWVPPWGWSVEPLSLDALIQLSGPRWGRGRKVTEAWSWSSWSVSHCNVPWMWLVLLYVYCATLCLKKQVHVWLTYKIVSTDHDTLGLWGVAGQRRKSQPCRRKVSSTTRECPRIYTVLVNRTFNLSCIMYHLDNIV